MKIYGFNLSNAPIDWRDYILAPLKVNDEFFGPVNDHLEIGGLLQAKEWMVGLLSRLTEIDPTNDQVYIIIYPTRTRIALAFMIVKFFDMLGCPNISLNIIGFDQCDYVSIFEFMMAGVLVYDDYYNKKGD